MMTKARPVKVKRAYQGHEWRPHFAWRPRYITFHVPGSGRDVNGGVALVGCWVFLDWIETKPRDDDNRAPWIYRLRSLE